MQQSGTVVDEDHRVKIVKTQHHQCASDILRLFKSLSPLFMHRIHIGVPPGIGLILPMIFHPELLHDPAQLMRGLISTVGRKMGLRTKIAPRLNQIRNIIQIHTGNPRLLCKQNGLISRSLLFLRSREGKLYDDGCDPLLQAKCDDLLQVLRPDGFLLHSRFRRNQIGFLRFHVNFKIHLRAKAL